MKTQKVVTMVAIIALMAVLFSGCDNSAEIEKLKKENKELKKQISQLTQDTEQKTDAIDSNNEDYKVRFLEEVTPRFFGHSDRNAEIKNIIIKYSPKMKKHLLIIDFHYKNNTHDAHDFINDTDCSVTVFQNGIELDTPGLTSEKNIYDTNNSYKRIKNAEIDTQLAFVLSDTESDIELELGWDCPESKKLIIYRSE